MKRGEIRWYTFESPDKRRPILILTRTPAISFLNAVTIAPITSTIRSIPTEVHLSQAEGLLAECAVNLDNIQTVPKSKIGKLITTLSSTRIDEVEQAISFALGFGSMIEAWAY